MVTLYSKFILNLWLLCKCLVFKGDIKSNPKSKYAYLTLTMIRLEKVGFNALEKGCFKWLRAASTVLGMLVMLVAMDVALWVMYSSMIG